MMGGGHDWGVHRFAWQDMSRVILIRSYPLSLPNRPASLQPTPHVPYAHYLEAEKTRTSLGPTKKTARHHFHKMISAVDKICISPGHRLGALYWKSLIWLTWTGPTSTPAFQLLINLSH